MQEAGASLTAQDSAGNQPLHEAATGASADLLQTLIRHGAPLDAQNAAAETPLHIAAKSKTVATIRTLVKAGANVRRPRLLCWNRLRASRRSFAGVYWWHPEQRRAWHTTCCPIV